MRHKLLYAFGLVALLAATYLLADLALKKFLSEARLRAMLIEPLQDQLGRRVEVGAIKVALFSGIEIRELVIKERRPEQEFVSIGLFRLTYELLPLLDRRLVIKEVLIEQPTVRIFRDQRGEFNFADLSFKPKKVVKEIPPPELQPPPPLPLTLIIDRVRVRGLNVTFSDQRGLLPAITSSAGDLTFSLTLGKSLRESRYQGSLELIVNGEYHSHRPVLLLKGNFDNQQGNFRGELSAGLDKLSLTGQLINLQTAPELTLNLQGSSFSLDNLGNGQAAAPAGPTMTSPAPKPGGQSKPAAPKFRAQGKIAVGELRRGRMTWRDFSLNYSWTDGLLAITGLTAKLFEGTISGQGSLDLSHPTPAFRGQIKADRLQLGAAAMAALDKPPGHLSGQFSGNFSGRGAGRDWPQIRASLVGQGKFALVGGGVSGSPLSRALAGLLGLPELENLTFERFSGTVQVAEARAALDASLVSRPLSIQGQGHLGLDGRLDLPLSVKLSPEYSLRLQEKAAFTRYLADPSGRLSLNLKLKGTVSQPDLRLNGEGAGRQLKNALGKKAGEALGRVLDKNHTGPASQNRQGIEAASGRLLDSLFGN